MSIADIRFNTKEEFVEFVKYAVRRKEEYKELRRNGATAAELEARGFGTVRTC